MKVFPCHISMLMTSLSSQQQVPQPSTSLKPTILPSMQTHSHQVKCSTLRQVKIALSIAFLDFSIDASAGASKYIEVSSAMLSTDRTQFQIMLKALDAGGIGAVETPFTRIRMSFIVVGS